MATISFISEALPSGHARVGPLLDMAPIWGVRPIPGKAMSVVEPRASAEGNPGRPSSQQSAAATAWPPAPSRLPEPRQYSPWNASSGQSQ